MMQVVTVKYDTVPVPVAIPSNLADVLDHIATVKRGRFGVITEHQSGIDDPKCERPTVSDITFITSPRYDRWLERMKAAVERTDAPPSRSLKEIETKLKGQTVQGLFDQAKKEILESLSNSQAGGGTDGHRLGHRLCYANFDAGDVAVTCHLVTDEDGEGHKRPVLNENGLMEINSLMLPFYTVTRKIIDAGVWKPTNSRALTLMKDSIKAATGIPEWKTISVGKGNFRTLTMDKAVVYGMVQEPFAVLQKQLTDFLSYLTGLDEGFSAAVQSLKPIEEKATVRS